MKKLLISALILSFIVGLISLQSCRRNFEFKEISNVSVDSMHLSGSVAMPLLNTKLTLGQYLPKTDSSLWVESDENDLLHLRMYFKEFITLPMSQIYPGQSPANQGDVINAKVFSLRSDTSKMKVHDKSLSGHLYFRDPKIKFKFNNSIPVLSFIKLDTVTFHDVNGTRLTYTQETSKIINYPTVSGTSVNDSIVVDKNLIPDLPNIFSPIPKYISFYVTAGSNQDQTLPFDVTGAEDVKIDVDIDLPLDARLEDLVLGDTIPFDWTGSTYSQVKELELRIDLDNGFPVEAITQIYFADSTYNGDPKNYIDSIFIDSSQPNIDERGWMLRGAEIDGTGVVTHPTPVSRIVTIIDQDRVQNLKDKHATQFIVKTKLNTKESQDPTQYVRFYSYYKFGVKIGLRVDFEGNTNDDFE